MCALRDGKEALGWGCSCGWSGWSWRTWGGRSRSTGAWGCGCRTAWRGSRTSRRGSAEAVDATYADLVAAGHEGRAEPFDSPWGPRYAMVLDPDGNEISLTAPEHWG
jgi:hypothetical protein